MRGRSTFENAALPHLHAAYNLARWLTCDGQDAEHVVQEAFIHALHHFERMDGQWGRQWLLRIVRGTCYAWLEKHRPAGLALPQGADEPPGEAPPATQDSLSPEVVLLRSADRELVNQALEQLPFAYREVIVMREIEAMSYEEIAAIIAVPIGTVMARLARGRALVSRAIEIGVRRALDQTSKRDLSATIENSTKARTRAGRNCAPL